MGLSVLVRISDATIHFGNGPYSITIEHCDPADTSVVLLQKAAENIPIFTLTATDVDPYIQSDQRRNAKGFLRQVLELHGVDEAELREYATRLATECIRSLDSSHEQSSCETLTPRHSLDANSEAPPKEAIELTSMNTILRPRIIETVSFLFEIDEAQLGDDIVGSVRTKRKWKSSPWSAAMALIYALSRVQELSTCSQLPLSQDAFDLLTNDEYKKTETGVVYEPILDTIRSFELICKLLLGRLYSKSYVSKAFLISSRGWSIFLDTMDAVDPADVKRGSLHIRLGVPARNGIRKARIIDGMGDFRVHSTRGLLLQSDPRISFWPGVWTAKLVGTHIGYHDHDAFTAVQTYDWAHSGQKCKKWRLGFREKQEMSMGFQVYRKCSCPRLQDAVETRRVLDNLLIWPVVAKQEAGKSLDKYIAKHPEDSWNASKIPERIFSNGETWFFYVTGDSAARWLGLEGLERLEWEESGYQLIIRGGGCCIQCAIRHSRRKALVLL